MQNRLHVAAVAAATALFGMFAAASPAQALVIDASYVGSGWTTNATTAVQNVINEFEGDFSNNVTVKVEFDWGSLNGGALNSGAATVFPGSDFLSPYGSQTGFTYAQVRTLYQNAALAPGATAVLQTASASLPATFPNNPGCCGGATPNNFMITDAEYLALTGTALNSDSIMAYVGFANDFCGVGQSNCAYDYSGNAPDSAHVDFTSVAEHELAHALSRVDYAFASGVAGGAPPFLTPQDLFRYDCNTTTPDPNFRRTCFSYDGGATNPGGRIFSDTSDSGDWLSCNDGQGPCPATGDSFDAYAARGEYSTISTADIDLMCAEGWNDQRVCGVTSNTSLPEPASIALLGSALIGLLPLRRRFRRRG